MRYLDPEFIKIYTSFIRLRHTAQRFCWKYFLLFHLFVKLFQQNGKKTKKQHPKFWILACTQCSHSWGCQELFWVEKILKTGRFSSHGSNENKNKKRSETSMRSTTERLRQFHLRVEFSRLKKKFTFQSGGALGKQTKTAGVFGLRSQAFSIKD